jgi:general secretion pathway protein L
LAASLQNSIITAAGNFWRWWRDELVQLLPMTVRSRLQHRRLLPVVVYGETEWELWAPRLESGRVARVKQTALDMAVGPEMQQLRARAAFAKLASPVVLSLPASMVLRRTLVLPEALAENLKQALAYDLDRHTPFRGDELYFDAQIVGRNAERGEIQVALAAVQRVRADAIMAQLREAGAEIVALSADPPENIESKLNLLPTEDRPSWEPWQRWAVFVGALLILLLLIATMALPVWQKRAYAIEVRQQADAAHTRAMEVDRLHNELDRLVADYDFIPERKEAYPSAVYILNEVTKLLPDDTWLTQMELKNTTGKEVRREVFLRGESAHASQLVTALEESGLLTQAAPRSPLTSIPGGGGGEMFDIGGQVKRLPAPERIAVATESKAVQPPILPITPQPVPAPAAPPPTPPVAESGQPVAAPAPPVVAVPPPVPVPAVAAPTPVVQIPKPTPARTVVPRPAPVAAPVVVPAAETADHAEETEDGHADDVPHDAVVEGGG